MNYLMKYPLAIKSLLFFAVVVFSCSGVYSKEIPKQPSPFMLVVDYANILGSNEKAQLEQKLRLFNDSSSTQITVVLDNSLEGEEIFDYSNRLAQAWGIGQKGKDNGVLIYAAIQDRRVYIQVGYGLESVVTDAASKKIIEEYIKPNFKTGNYFQGLDKATDIVMQLSQNEFTADQFAKKGKGSKFPFAIFIMIVFFAIYMMRGTGFMGGLMMGSMWGSFSSGSGSFGGGSSGFGGGSFGGGSFGGGGAGGSW